MGAFDVPDGLSAVRVELSAENTWLKKLLAESLLENEVTHEALGKKWQPHRLDESWCGT